MDLGQEQGHPRSRIRDPVAMAVRDPGDEAMQPQSAQIVGNASVWPGSDPWQGLGQPRQADKLGAIAGGILALGAVGQGDDACRYLAN